MYLINVEKNNFWQFCEEYFLVLCSFYFKKEKCKCLDLASTHNNNNKKAKHYFYSSLPWFAVFEFTRPIR